jgi:ribosomal-protein-alanine N-acetyltransferase
MSGAEGFFPEQAPAKIARHIRWIIKADLPAVTRIETAAQERPLLTEELETMLRQRNCIGLVVQEDERILAYCVYALEKDEIELLVLAVDPKRQRQGIGRMLMERLKHKLSQQGRKRLTCVCRDTEDVAHYFLKASGMRATEVVRSLYLDGSDGYCFTYKVTETVEAT